MYRIIGGDEAKALARMEAEHPQSHVLLGILNMQAGVRDSAVRHFEQVKADDPYAGVARKSLVRLRSY